MEEDLQQKDVPAPEQSYEHQENQAGQLENILKNLNEANVSGNRPKENSLYKEAEDLFKSLTGEDLMEKAAAAAKEEIESEGLKISQNKDTLSEENFKKEIEGFKFKQQSQAAKKALELLSEEEKKQFGGDVNPFISEMEKKIEELKKNGLNIPKEIFYNMMAAGYMLYNMKNNLFGIKVRIPVLITAGAYKFKTISKKDFRDLMAIMQNFFDLTASQAVEDELNRKIAGGKGKWRRRKLRKARELLKDLIERSDMEKRAELEKPRLMKTIEEEVRTKIQKEVESETREALEKISQIGGIGVLKRLKDFEELEKETDRKIKQDIKKVQASLERDIKQRAKEEKKIGKIMKKQMKKGKISKKRTAFVDSATKKEAPPVQEEAPPQNNEVPQNN